MSGKQLSGWERNKAENKRQENMRKEHEGSSEHGEFTKACLVQSNTLGKIDTKIHKYFEERDYWVNILRRVVVVIKFLTSGRLASRSTTEKFGTTNNENYLGSLELLAEFDPFLKTHFKTKGNPGKRRVSYMSSITCEEFIKLMAMGIREKFSSEIKNTKYISIVADSTPDISHTDQLTVVLRYVFENSSSVKRWEIMEKSLIRNKIADEPAQLMLKRLSTTIWSATALYNSYDTFKEALKVTVADTAQSPETKAESKGVLQKMLNLENGFILLFWKDFLIQFHKVSQFLQNQSTNVLIAIQLCESLISFVGNIRQKFDKYEEDGKILTKRCDYGLDTK
ncbi:hypothetical protein ILUMI_18890 [Ignelater luminosus]|uniref:DUF4371 domain-containing protein n=1 Tax=Ignelater luminosus TaxID=2038154 RepID=A0A8K0CMQ8_IGNLU|nr:hypothetical protein ILUMI_18890 [Ignelater luminosus]